MDEHYYVARATPIRDLVALARQAADQLRGREGTSALANAIDGASVEVALDMADPVLA